MKFKSKPVINKKNGQWSITLPKKKLPKIVDEFEPNKKLNVCIEGWDD